MSRPLCISCQPEDLDQGLFGNVLAHSFQILPYLYEQQIYPAWEIRTKHYGDPPDFITLPGALDLNYDPPRGPYRTLSLNELRRRHGQILGNDWNALAVIWNAYFKVPQRVLDLAKKILPQGRVLGIHYRGTDKQTSTWDSNPITSQQYLGLIQDYLAQSDRFNYVFVATDEHSFVDQVRASIHLPILDLGAVEFHMATEHTMTRGEKTDRAMLDCVLLSQCDVVIETSSALPSFAKLLSPGLEIFRCSASKIFTNMPYFPVAYIPRLPVDTPESLEILRCTMEGDWETNPEMARFRKTFAFAPRWPRNHALFNFAEKTGFEDLAARLFSGYF